MPDCPACTTTYAEGLPTCPQCGAEAPTQRGRAVPLVVVECATEGCVAYGHPRSVQLIRAGSWLYELPRLLCAACGTETRTVQEVTMPKITAHGGPSVSGAEDSAEAEPAAPEPPAEPVAEATAEPATIATATARPIVNAPKGDWLAYAEAAYGVYQTWADGEYNKADLIAAVGALETGAAVVVDGQIVADDAG